MKYNGMSRSHLFLIELIIVILFFSFAGAITVQVFSKAYELDRDTEALNGAIMTAQTAAETDKTLPLNSIGSSTSTIYLDSSWKPSDPKDAVYTLTSSADLETRPSGTMVIHYYNVTFKDKTVYKLESKKYYSGEFINGSSQSEAN